MKRSEKTDESREWIKIAVGVALAVFGMAIVVIGLFIEPAGIIHPSVVAAFTAVLAASATMFGIDAHAKVKMKEKDVEYRLRSREIGRKTGDVGESAI